MEANEVWDKPPIFSSKPSPLVFDLAFFTQTVSLILDPSDSIAASSRMRVMERGGQGNAPGVQSQPSLGAVGNQEGEQSRQEKGD